MAFDFIASHKIYFQYSAYESILTLDGDTNTYYNTVQKLLLL